jgi:hypothetical protein
VVVDDAEKLGRVRSADRLALVEDRRDSREERAVADVRVADDPAEVGRRPPNLKPRPGKKKLSPKSSLPQIIDNNERNG